MGNSMSSAVCCTDSDGPGAAHKLEFPPDRKGPLSARRRADLPPGQVNAGSPTKADNSSQFVSNGREQEVNTSSKEESAIDQDRRKGPPLRSQKMNTPDIPYPAIRKQPWRLNPAEESVGVGAHFEATQSGAIRVRGLAKGGPAELSGLFSVGDELVEVDGTRTFGRPLSELGQFVLGKPGSQVRMILVSAKNNQRYEACVARGKGADAPTKICIEPPVGEYQDTLRL